MSNPYKRYVQICWRSWRAMDRNLESPRSAGAAPEVNLKELVMVRICRRRGPVKARGPVSPISTGYTPRIWLSECPELPSQTARRPGTHHPRPPLFAAASESLWGWCRQSHWCCWPCYCPHILLPFLSLQWNHHHCLYHRHHLLNLPTRRWNN